MIGDGHLQATICMSPVDAAARRLSRHVTDKSGNRVSFRCFTARGYASAVADAARPSPEASTAGNHGGKAAYRPPVMPAKFVPRQQSRPERDGKQVKKTSAPDNLLRHVYQPRPKPLNCTTQYSTRLIATDTAHPLHTKMQRRLASFDPSRLHWRVSVPAPVSKKAAIRNFAKKRVQREVAKALKERELPKDLSGALLILLPNDPARALGFQREDCRQSVRWIIEKVVDQWNTEKSNPQNATAKYAPYVSKRTQRSTNEGSQSLERGKVHGGKAHVTAKSAQEKRDRLMPPAR